MSLDQDPVSPNRDFMVVGSRPVRPDGVDKVTGRAKYGADLGAPGMLIAKVLRSPHAHARIRSIDTSKAMALPGVKAVVTAADFGSVRRSLRAVLENCMAQRKALYDGHAVAAIAAVNGEIADAALELIRVDYEVLAHVTDVEAAMADDAPLLHEDMITQGVDPAPTKPSNIAQFVELGHGDVAKGFAAADVVIERSFKTEATHQGYIEPHACLASVSQDGMAELWCCTQGHFVVRDTCAQLCDIDASRLRVTASEIGGGFGGKTTVFIEPLALMLSKKSGRPVKIVMSRGEVFKATGPTSSTMMKVRIGATKAGRITAGAAELCYQGGAFPGAPVEFGAMSAFACYDLENLHVSGYDVVVNRPRQAPYRAPGAPMSTFAVESVVDEMAVRLGLDPVDFRLKNASSTGSKSAYGPKFGIIGLEETLRAAKAHPHYTAPLNLGEGRGIACGFWFNFGGQTSVSMNLQMDGTVNLSLGTPDIGGSRASMCLMAAEELGIPYDKIKAIIADTASLGYNDTSEGSRVTFSAGMATIAAAQDAVAKLCHRAALIWDISGDAVVWENGEAKPSGANAGEFDPLSLADIAAKAGDTGGPIAGHSEINADGAGVSFATHIVDSEVDQETGQVKILRYTVVQDAGKAIHPSYVEGQFQGGAAQGIGWALNEEYIYGADGRMQNASFLDYRLPVASDLPMIDTVIIEVANPDHPYGVRGVGETSIVPPLAAVANSVSAAAGVRLTHLPMSPPRVLQAIDAAKLAAKYAVE